MKKIITDLLKMFDIDNRQINIVCNNYNDNHIRIKDKEKLIV